MTPEAFRCADSSEARDEPLYGTASIVGRWLLVEQPGSWGSDALLRLSGAAGVELRRRARAARTRIVLIRRGARFADTGRNCYFARTQDCDTYLAHVSVDSLDELIDVDLTALERGDPVPGATTTAGPMFLVCTHGRHDACCSIRGNLVSRAACAIEGADAWECSHIGGDRFAANLVCFPHGIYYGRVRPDDTRALVDGYRAGRISLSHYRGRCCYSFDVQAAEYFLRREMGLSGVDDVTLVGPPSRSAAGTSARFAIKGGASAEIRVAVRQSSSHYQLTCTSTIARAIPRFDLLSVTAERDPGGN